MFPIFAQRLTPPDKTPALDLKRVFVLRNIALSTVVIIVFLTHYVLKLELPLTPLLIVMALLGCLNIYTYVRLERSPQISALEFFTQLVVDVIFLTALLYYTGGSTNPFVSLFLLPLVIIATALPHVYTWAMAALSITCYTLLMFFYIPLPHINTGHFTNSDLHTFGMWFGFLIGVGLIVFVVVRMANSLRESDRILAQSREKSLRDEHLVALGTLATGAAHELGTPLATMAVVTKELEHEYAGSPALIEKITLLRQQIDRCKNTLSVLSDQAGQAKAESGRSFAVDHYLDNVLSQWRSMRPKAEVQYRWNGVRPAPHIVADTSLSQAFINLLNNAADASINNVEVAGTWNSDKLVFEVCDRGTGINPVIQDNAGKLFFTTKADGHGLGLFLAQAVINRFGGSLKLFNREGGGACTRIELPLSRLLATPA